MRIILATFVFLISFMAPCALRADDAPPGYAVEVANDAGKSLLTQKPNITSVQMALEAVFPDLANYFGVRPLVGKAYQDAKDHNSGGATFTVTLKDRTDRGFVSCRINEKGATIAVVFGRTDASREAWDKLMNPTNDAAPATAPAFDPAIAAVLGPNAKMYAFPDGTGSVAVADGWTTAAQSAIDPVFIKGPANQTVVLGNSVVISTPDSPNVKMVEQNQATMRRMGGNPPPAPPMLIAEFTDPVQAMTDLAPQFDKLSQFRGGPAVHLDKIISHEDLPAAIPGAKAAVVVFENTRTSNGVATSYRITQRVQMIPVVSGTWTLVVSGFSAPIDSFDRDKPIMWAMVKSLKVDSDAASRVMQDRNAQASEMLRKNAQANQALLNSRYQQFQRDQNRRFAEGQAQHAEQERGYAQHNEQWKAYELQRSRNNADFVETIRGTRTVYDTKTGQAGTADLSRVDGVVDSLNAAALDPNRFIQIPLRDEMYPK